MGIPSPNQLRAICQVGKDSDPAWYVVHRRWSIYATWALLHTPITPNQVTGLMMLAGAAGAALIVPHSFWLNLLGFAVLYLSFLLDKVDGEVARYRRQTSTRGLLLDRMHHLLIEPLVFLAAAWHEWIASGSVAPWNAGWAVIVLGNLVDEHQHLSAYILFKHLRLTRSRPPEAPRHPSRGLQTVFKLMRPLKAFRMFVVAVPAFAIAYLVEKWTGWDADRYYLYASVVSLAALLVFQFYYYFNFKLAAEIDQQAEFLANSTVGGERELGIVPEPEEETRLRAVHRR